MGLLIAVLGAGPHGRELAEVAYCSHKHVIFLDDNTEIPDVFGPLAELGQPDLGRYVIGAAWPAVRRAIDEKIAEAVERKEAATLVHPTASLAKRWPGVEAATMQGGSVLWAGARVGPGTRIGHHTHVKANATVAHSCEIGDFVTIAPGANVTGEVRIEDDVFIGAGAVVRNGGLVIGAGAVVGMGAVVVRDVKPGEVVMGNPARVR